MAERRKLKTAIHLTARQRPNSFESPRLSIDWPNYGCLRLFGAPRTRIAGRFLVAGHDRLFRQRVPAGIFAKRPFHQPVFQRMKADDGQAAAGNGRQPYFRQLGNVRKADT